MKPTQCPTTFGQLRCIDKENHRSQHTILLGLNDYLTFSEIPPTTCHSPHPYDNLICRKTAGHSAYHAAITDHNKFIRWQNRPR